MLLHSAHKAFKAKAMENFEKLFPDQIKHLKSRFKASLESKIDGGFTLIKGKIQNLQVRYNFNKKRLPSSPISEMTNTFFRFRLNNVYPRSTVLGKTWKFLQKFPNCKNKTRKKIRCIFCRLQAPAQSSSSSFLVWWTLSCCDELMHPIYLKGKLR